MEIWINTHILQFAMNFELKIRTLRGNETKVVKSAGSCFEFTKLDYIWLEMQFGGAESLRQ